MGNEEKINMAIKLIDNFRETLLKHSLLGASITQIQEFNKNVNVVISGLNEVKKDIDNKEFDLFK